MASKSAFNSTSDSVSSPIKESRIIQTHSSFDAPQDLESALKLAHEVNIARQNSQDIHQEPVISDTHSAVKSSPSIRVKARISNQADKIIDVIPNFPDFTVQKKKLQALAQTKEFWIWVGGASGVVLLFLLLTLNFGWDKGLLKADIQGEVQDPDKRGLANAQVTCHPKSSSDAKNDISTQTTENGFYALRHVSYGDYTCRIVATGYASQQTDIKLGRLEKKEVDFNVEKLEYSTIKGKIVSKLTSPDFSQLIVKVADQTLSVDAQGNVTSAKLPIGKQMLILQSSRYKDIKLDVDLKPGENEIPDLSLEIAKDLQVNIKNWITNNILYEVNTIIQGTTYKSDEKGILTITDLDPNQKLDLIFKKDGYNDLSTSVDLRDKTSLDIQMVPKGRIMYTSDREGLSNIYSSNYDGTDEKKATDGKGHIYKPVLSGDKVLFYSDREALTALTQDQVYSTDIIGGGAITRQSNLVGYQSDATSFTSEQSFLPAQRVTYIQSSNANINPKKLKLSIAGLDRNNPKTLFDVTLQNGTEGEVPRQILSNDGNWLMYSVIIKNSSTQQVQQSKLSVANTSTTTLNDIYSSSSPNIQITPVGFSASSRQVAFTTYENSRQTLHIYNQGSQKDKTFDNLGLDELNTKFSDDGKFIYFLSSRDGKHDIYRLEMETSETIKITDTSKTGRFTIQDSFLFFDNDGEMDVLDLNVPSVVKKTPISTNFSMWGDTNFTL